VIKEKEDRPTENQEKSQNNVSDREEKSSIKNKKNDRTKRYGHNGR
jgi:hypothetical protein